LLEKPTAFDPATDVSALLEKPTAFDPATDVSAEFHDDLAAKLTQLMNATDRLATKVEKEKKDSAAACQVKVSLEELHAQLRRETASASAQRRELSVLPEVGVPMTLFAECDELMLSGDIEQVLLGAEVAARVGSDKEARLAALQGLRLSLDDAASKLAAAGVALRPDFIDFAEMSMAKGLRVCCLSRGLKQLIRHLLREEGLGHVEVLAHDMSVERDGSHAWKVCFRDDSDTGHDKAESMRRALKGKGAVVLVGRTACDFAPVNAGMVHCLYAPPASALAQAADAAGITHRSFDGWSEVTASLLMRG